MRRTHRHASRARFSLALSARLAIAGIATGLIGPAGCTTPAPMAEPSIAADSSITAARRQVVFTAVGLKVGTNANGRSTLGAVSPVTCVRLPGGDLLTAAHAMPNGYLGAVRATRDPETGEYAFDTSSSIATNGPPIVLITDSSVGGARVSASETLRYAAAGSASRESVPVDWAIITPDRRTRWASPVERIATPVPGEGCFMIGFPKALMDEGYFDVSGGVTDASDLPWLGAPGVVIEGVIGRVEADRITVETEGVLGSRGRGLSGGGVFVRRGGEPALVGIAVQASRMSAVVTVCPLPTEVTRRFGG